jgi:hypothetical protein
VLAWVRPDFVGWSLNEDFKVLGEDGKTVKELSRKLDIPWILHVWLFLTWDIDCRRLN